MKRFLLTVLLLGCGSSKAEQPPVTPPADTGSVILADTKPQPGPGDPPACDGEPSAGTPPSPRFDHAGVLDPSGKKLVIFGGDTEIPACGAPSASKFVAETFVLDVGCGSFRKVDATGPSARAGHVMVTDHNRGRAVVFGGRSASALFNDVFGFDFATEKWAKLETSGAVPTPRAGATAVFDRKRDRMIVFGGNTNPAGVTASNETFALSWEFREWKQIGMNGTKPVSRWSHGAALDEENSKLYVFGGDERGSTPFLDDLWVLDLASDTWSKITTTGDAPKGRIQAGVSFDTGMKRLVVFGGNDGVELGNRNDIHALDVATSSWIRFNSGDTLGKPATAVCTWPADFAVIDKNAPERRSAFAFAATTDGRGFVVHGGRSECGLLGDVVWYNVLNELYFPIVQSTVGHSCPRNNESCTSLCR